MIWLHAITIPTVFFFLRLYHLGGLVFMSCVFRPFLSRIKKHIFTRVYAAGQVAACTLCNGRRKEGAAAVTEWLWTMDSSLWRFHNRNLYLYSPIRDIQKTFLALFQLLPYVLYIQYIRMCARRLAIAPRWGLTFIEPLYTRYTPGELLLSVDLFLRPIASSIN